jgi:26S proteasome regulatory subunit N3
MGVSINKHMQIEQSNGQEEVVVVKETVTLDSLVLSLFKQLTNLNERKSSTETALLTSLLKKCATLVDREGLERLLGQTNSMYNMSVIGYLNEPSGDFPRPGSEQDIAVALLSSLLLYKQKQYSQCQSILGSLLFEKPHTLAQRTYLESLTNYTFYKYLNCIELGGGFEQSKQSLYVQLRELQSTKNEVLFSTLYIFVLRNLLRSDRLREAHQLLKNFKFPENIQYVYYSKYLFYKALFLGSVGQYQKAFTMMNSAFRKAPERKVSSTKGVNCFSLLVQKHTIVLSLMLNELPSIDTFTGVPELLPYKELVKLVTQGHKEEFGRFLNRNRDLFEQDLVLELLTKMEPVVLRNAVKKLSITYTRISIPDLLMKMGISEADNFDIQSFLTKSKDYIEKFQIDPQNNLIDFTHTTERYSDSTVRETLMKRISHLNILEEQVTKSLRYPEQKEEKKVKADDDDIDLDDLDLSLDDMLI